MERTLISEEQENHAIVFAAVMEILHGSGCFDKVEESFSWQSFEESGFYTCVDDGCRQHDISD